MHEDAATYERSASRIILLEDGQLDRSRDVQSGDGPREQYLPDPTFDPVASRYWESGGTD
jgi:hypothetical protein